MPNSLRVPELSERLVTAADIAGLTPAQLRDGLRDLGVEMGEKSIYKLFNGSVKKAPLPVLAGLARVLGTDVRWFCEPDDDGELHRALNAHWRPIHRHD